MDVYDSPSLDEQIEHMQRRAALYRPNEHRVLLAAWRVVLEHFVAIGDRDAFYQVLPLCWDIFRVAARVIPSPTMDGIKLQGGQMVAMLGECMRRRDMGYGRYCAALRSERVMRLDRYCVYAPLTEVTLLLDESPSPSPPTWLMPDGTSLSEWDAVLAFVAAAKQVPLAPHDSYQSLLPHLRRITIDFVGIPQAHRTPIRLFFASDDGQDSPQLRCITGTLDTSPLSFKLQGLLAPHHQRSFCMHLDENTMNGNYQMISLRLPLPRYIQHLVISFPIFPYKPESVLQWTGQLRNEHATERLAWLQAFVLTLQARKQGPILLEIVGLFAYYDAPIEIEAAGHLWDGLRRKQAVDCTQTPPEARFHLANLHNVVDKTWQAIGNSIRKILGAPREYLSLDTAIDDLTYRPDKYVPASQIGEVYLTFRPVMVDTACATCNQPYASLKPFETTSYIPREIQMLEVESQIITVSKSHVEQHHGPPNR